MKEFVRPLDKTIFGRIRKAKLSDSENEIRKFILKTYISNGKSPDIQDLYKYFNISENVIVLVLEKLHKFDIISFKNGQISCSYPFSNKASEFLVEIANNSNVYALCATDAFGIHFMTNEKCVVKTKCPYCFAEIEIQLGAGKITNQKPGNIVEFVSLPENCKCTSESFCPTIKFFCSKEHINEWKLNQKYDFEGEIYSLDEVLYHSEKIFCDLLIL
jgi:hypothetical protein